MSKRESLVVIGAGSAGLTAATFAAQVGVSVTLIERHRIGGDCTWTGCVPSKTLIHIAQMAHVARQAAAVGVHVGTPTIDFAQVMATVRAAIARIYATETPEALEQKGVAVRFGAAQFRDSDTLTIDHEVLAPRHVIIATGSRARVPSIPGLADTPFLTNDTIFSLTELPKRLVILGGGPMGCELGQAFARLGAHVTIIERAARLLPSHDPDAAAIVAAQFRSEGIEARCGVTVTRVDHEHGQFQLTTTSGAVTADALLVAVGRVPNVEGLGLENAGVTVREQGIVVNQRLQTTNPRVYACGDVLGGPFHTSYAGWQGAQAVRNALLPGSTNAIRRRVPHVTFTDPMIAEAGLTPSAARAAGRDVRLHTTPMSRNDRAQTMGRADGFVTVVATPNGRVCGGVAVGVGADEVINEIALAADRKLSLADVASSIHAYPTVGTALQMATADGYLAQLTRGPRGWLLRVALRR